VGHCSYKDDQLVLSRSQFVNSTVEVVCTCPNNSQSWMPTEGLRRLEFPICGPWNPRLRWPATYRSECEELPMH
jgi:hypothetical protein